MLTMLKSLKKGILIILICFLLPLFFIPSCTATSTTIYVDISNSTGPWDGTSENPYNSIQNAIDSASDDSTIQIASGTYDETLHIQKNILIVGESRDSTILDGNQNGHVIFVQGTASQTLTFEITDITVKNAGGLGYDCIALSYVSSGSITNNLLSASDQSDGIQLDHCSNVNIENNQIQNNKGSGISLTLSSDNTIANNYIDNNQKGIYIYLTSNNNLITENTIKDNSQYGVYIVQSMNNQLYLNDFKDNGQNAQDTSTNQWYYSNQGNYWDDLNAYDKEPEDGIGDNPYEIPGGSNQDSYPLGYFLESIPAQSGNQPPTAYKPTIYPTTADYQEKVTFNGGGTDPDGSIVEYSWRSTIDGQLSNKMTFSTTSLSIGTHSIYFKVRDNDGEWSSEKSTTITINSITNQNPTATIIYVKPTQIDVGESLFFNGEGSDTDGTITSYKWSSNKDGVLGSKKSFSINNLSVGTHSISFQVQDNQEAWSSVQKTTITVINLNNTDVLTANSGGPYIENDFHVSFDASQSTAGVDYFWDFGDGNFGSGMQVAHTYTSEGNYTIKLTVRDHDGNIDYSTSYVNITASPASQSSSSTEKLSVDIPMPLIIIAQVLIVISCIGFFFYWMKHK